MFEENIFLFQLILRYNRARTEKSREKLSFEIVRQCKTLNDLLDVIPSCPRDSILHMKISAILLESIDARPLEVLAKMYERNPWDDVIKQRSLALIKERAQTTEDWAAVLSSLRFPEHELADLTLENLMNEPIEKKNALRLHRISRPASPHRKFLENILILPYLDQMSVLDLIDVTLLAAPKSVLVAKAHEILDSTKERELRA